MDDVVQSYHNGFNKAIHNYSRILRLFSESKDQVSLLQWVSLQLCAADESAPQTGLRCRGCQRQALKQP